MFSLDKNSKDTEKEETIARISDKIYAMNPLK